MDLEINIGRRRDDGKLIVNFGEKRELLWADIRFVQGIALEEIFGEIDMPLYGMILIDDKWNGKLYFSKKHDSWSKNDYFDFAERRFRELGISHLTII